MYIIYLGPFGSRGVLNVTEGRARSVRINFFAAPFMPGSPSRKQTLLRRPSEQSALIAGIRFTPASPLLRRVPGVCTNGERPSPWSAFRG